MRYLLIALLLLVDATATAAGRVSTTINAPGVSIGFNLPLFPELVLVPGYPVYYAPRTNANYFFYDGAYWVYANDNWYASDWYNGPWDLVEPVYVPTYVLLVPVRYYRQPPRYFHQWYDDAPPRWGAHWGRNWEQRRPGWDRWDRRAVPLAAPLPLYQRPYAGQRYPHGQAERRALRDQRYNYVPREALTERQIGRGGRIDSRRPNNVPAARQPESPRDERGRQRGEPESRDEQGNGPPSDERRDERRDGRGDNQPSGPPRGSDRQRPDQQRRFEEQQRADEQQRQFDDRQRAGQQRRADEQQRLEAQQRAEQQQRDVEQQRAEQRAFQGQERAQQPQGQTGQLPEHGRQHGPQQSNPDAGAPPAAPPAANTPPPPEPRADRGGRGAPPPSAATSAAPVPAPPSADSVGDRAASERGAQQVPAADEPGADRSDPRRQGGRGRFDRRGSSAERQSQ